MPRLHKAFQHHQLKGDFLQETLEHILYLTDVEISRLLIIGDTRRIRIIDLDHDMTSADGMELGRTEFELAELPDHVDDLKSLADYGMVQVGSREQEQASIRVARVMADLYEAMDESGYSDHEASIFLIRTLFCLYGDDADLWERDLFAEFLDTRTREDGSGPGAQLAFSRQKTLRRNVPPSLFPLFQTPKFLLYD